MTANTKNIPTQSLDTSEKSKQLDSTVGSYLICEKIGQGSFATVYKAQHKVSGHWVAIKSVLRSKLTKKLQENLESEISILKAIRHDHIVGLSECQKTDTHIHLVMDYCALGDLSQYIKQERSSKPTRGPLGGLPENTVRHFLKQLASALRFLRSQNLVHRDIKPQNLLLVSPQNIGQHSSERLPILQVADFGFARFLPNASMADTLCGSPLYMGPEILSYKKYDAKADLWSVGAVLYEMVTGKPPFRAQNHLELLKKIQKNDDVIRFPDEKASGLSSPTIGDDLKDLIRKLLKKDPVERISFEEFFVHPAILAVDPSAPSPTPPASTYSSSASSSSFSTTHAHSPHQISTATPPRPISKQRYDQPTIYETPPFAQHSSSPSSSPYQDIRKMAYGSSSPTRQTLTKVYRDVNGNVSPAHSRGRSTKTVEFKDTSSDGMHETGTVIKRSTRHGEEEIFHEYVLLDRRTIETNQFADEISASPHGNDSKRYPYRRQSVAQESIPRRNSSSSSCSSSYDQNGNAPISSSPKTPPFAVSRERRISAGAAGSALAKALSMASERLFGTGQSPPNYNKLQQTMIGSPRGFLMMNGQHSPVGELEAADDDKTMAMIEKAACMGHAVAKFADSKFELLVSGRGGIGVTNESTLAAEALVLHLKALELLELGFEMAKKYWHGRRLSSDLQQDQREPLASKSVAIRLNDAVQWMRERFNECLDRASFEKSKCDHADTMSDTSANNPCVEKLLYDRALEMSRAAAVHELVGENIAECEKDYRTAIWMLEAILEVCNNKEMAIEEDDRKIINKFIDSIQQRISILRKKLLDQKEQKFPYHSPTSQTYLTEQR